jgi:hypothetical protein
MTTPAAAEIARHLAPALDPTLLMDSAGIAPDPWQADLLRSNAKQMLLLAARQAGKSTVTAALAMHEALFNPPALVLLLSPSLRQSSELLRKVVGFYRALKDEAVPVKDESALRLELRNGSRIVSLPGDETTIRGYSGVRLLVVDEAARVPDDLYFSIRPMLAVSGGRLVCLSTPFGKRGFFYEAWAEGQGWQRVRITARECPRISAAFLEEERASMGEWWFRQEYECEFVDTSDQVFGHDLVMQALSAEVEPLFQEPIAK